jgi:hypothetical protein
MECYIRDIRAHARNCRTVSAAFTCQLRTLERHIVLPQPPRPIARCFTDRKNARIHPGHSSVGSSKHAPRPRNYSQESKP